MGLLYSSKKDKELTIRGREADGPTSAGVAQLKEVYFKGDALSKQGSQGEAIETFESALPVISQTAPQLASSSDLRKWTELLLTSYCLCSSKTVRSSNSSTLGTDSLAAFRAWADFWERQPGNQNVAVGGKLEDAEVSRRHVWKEYYATISYILQNDLTCPTTHTTTAYNDHALRLVQKSELERVEHRYEQLLLAEVHFPKAESHSQEVEEWVDMAIRNWKVLAGSSWDEQALGAGGRAVLGPNILEILYRAATKTYHSTHILRQLFTVHLALAHFDLALKAFDTYFDIVKKAKLRVEKTGIEEAGLDTDDELLETASRCITALCRFGGLEAAEKAKDLAHYLECWLEGHDPCGTGSPAVDGGVNGAQKMIAKDDYGEAHTISPQVLVQTWRSIGIARAQFARLTHDPKARGQYQLKAIDNLTKALSAAFMQSDDIDALYALALILAERRQIDEAILVVGQALAPKHESASAAYADSYSGRYARERSLIPLWHLLALLFSANEEFTEASQACEGAFKQFGRMDVLFGDADAPYQSEHLNRLQEKPVKKVVLDDMDDFERETVLEVKMTQLILTEVQDGPEEAINGTEELLSLYTRLFGNPSTPAVSPPKSSEHPPTTSNGTLRSVKGSIFGRRRRRDASGATLVSTSEKPATPPSAVNPKIQVTGENGTSPTKYRHGHHSHKSEHLLRKKSQSSMKHRNVSAPVPPDQNQQQTQQITPVSNTHDDLLNEVGYQIPQTSLSARLCTPVTRFSAEQGKRHKVGILARVWLLIAGFYRRAEQWEDAKAAIDAAYELVEGMEGEIIRDTSGKIHTDERGWGVGKCVEELWGDIWAEVSHQMPFSP